MARNGRISLFFRRDRDARTCWLAGFALLLSLLSPFAFAGIVTGELDKGEGSLDDQFTYVLTVQGKVDKEPEFPSIDGLDIQGTGKSQNVSMSNKGFTRETQYQYTLVPSRVGTFSIPPIKVSVDGSWQQTLPLEIKVQALAPAPDAGARHDQAVFIERDFSKQKVYLGETISSRLRVFQKVKIYGASQDPKYPSSFQARSIEEQKSYTQVIGGEEYSVTELQTILTPNEAGHFVLEPAIVKAQIAAPRRRSRSMLDDFMNPTEVVQKSFVSTPATIEVLPLPSAGRREDFSGLVGEYEASAEISSRDLKVGDTATLTLTVSGQGSTAGMADPEFNYGERAKVYKDKPQSLDAVEREGVKGRRILKFAIVPTQPGVLKLGQLTIQYFNTGSARYEDITVDLGSLQVSGEARANPAAPLAAAPQAPPAATSPAREVASLGEDLIELHGPGRLLRQEAPRRGEWALAGASSLLSFGFLAFGLWRKQRERSAPERLAKRRASEAWTRLRRHLDETEHDLQASNVRPLIAGAHQRWKAYFSDKFGIKASSLTYAELEQHLAPFLKDTKTLSSVGDLWMSYDRLLFGAVEPTLQEAKNLIETSKKVMQEVDQRC